MIRDGYDGVVYDLDGTLVRLAVDWTATARDVEAVYREAGVDPGGRNLWDLMVDAEGDLAAAVEEAVAAREREGARESSRLSLADELLALDRPAAVCSLNCEAACRIALDRHGLSDRVAAVVGRDSVEGRKPDPEPLLAAIARLDLDPGEVVFVGDSERDAVTARRAGVDFSFVEPDRTDR